MNQQIFASILDSLPAFLVLLGVNGIFLALGIIAGSLWVAGFQQRKAQTAFDQGVLHARAELAQEKKAFSQDISIELEKLRDGIIGSARAYKDAISVIETKVGFSPEDIKRLKIDTTKDDGRLLLPERQHVEEEHMSAKFSPSNSDAASENLQDPLGVEEQAVVGI